jgi:hypothetical protein
MYPGRALESAEMLRYLLLSPVVLLAIYRTYKLLNNYVAARQV